jgi:hypothetical protein
MMMWVDERQAPVGGEQVSWRKVDPDGLLASHCPAGGFGRRLCLSVVTLLPLTDIRVIDRMVKR